MTQAIGILELTSIARGMELGDVMLKSANVQLLLCRTLCPGKFLLMLGGDVAPCSRQSPPAPRALGRCCGQPGAGQHSPQRTTGDQRSQRGRAAAGGGDRRNLERGGVHQRADRAVKAANVTLVRVHMAFGIGGKCYMVVAGDIADVDNAVTVASDSAGEKGLLVHRAVIPRPHDALWQQLMEG